MSVLCRNCGVECLWAVTVRNRRMLIDLEPRPDGNLATWRDAASTLRCRVVPKDGSAPLQSWERPGMPHAATCTPPSASVPQTRDGAANLRAYRAQRANQRRRVQW